MTTAPVHGNRRSKNFRCFGAPHVAIVTTDAELGFYGGVDCGLYLMSFMLALRAHGVDSIAQAALASHPDTLRRHIALDPSRRIVCGVARIRRPRASGQRLPHGARPADRGRVLVRVIAWRGSSDVLPRCVDRGATVRRSSGQVLVAMRHFTSRQRSRRR